jgi:hypothetical protein
MLAYFGAHRAPLQKSQSDARTRRTPTPKAFASPKAFANCNPRFSIFAAKRFGSAMRLRIAFYRHGVTMFATMDDST